MGLFFYSDSPGTVFRSREVATFDFLYNFPQ